MRDFWFIVATRSIDETEIRTGQVPPERVPKDIRPQNMPEYPSAEKMLSSNKECRATRISLEISRPRYCRLNVHGGSKDFLGTDRHRLAAVRRVWQLLAR